MKIVTVVCSTSSGQFSPHTAVCY